MFGQKKPTLSNASAFYKSSPFLQSMAAAAQNRLKKKALNLVKGPSPTVPVLATPNQKTTLKTSIPSPVSAISGTH